MSGQLGPPDKTITISDGDLFESVSEEYEDAIEYTQIIYMGRVLSPSYYNRWLAISNKYGLQTSED